MALAIHDSEYKHLKFIKGTYLASRSNGTKPVAGVILLEKKSSHDEALFTLTNPDTIAPQIHFELMQKRLAVDDEKISSFSDFATHTVYKTLKDIVGIYVLGFIKKSRDEGKLRAITKGICEITKTGDVKLWIGNNPHNLQGHVINTSFHNSNIIRITNYFVDSKEEVFRSKYEYILEVERNKKKTDHPVTQLKGIYAGVETKNVPRGGEIIFIKIDGYKTFDDAVKKEIPEHGFFSMDSPKPSIIDKALIEHFTIDKIYERNYLVINTPEAIVKKK